MNEILKKIENLNTQITKNNQFLKLLFSSDKSLYGFISFKSLSVTLNRDIMEKLVSRKHNFNDALKRLSEIGEMLSIEEIRKDPNIELYHKMEQIGIHEMFHLYQIMTCPILLEYTKVARKIELYKWYTFNISTSYGFKYNLHKHNEILSADALESAKHDEYTLSEIQYDSEDLKEYHEVIFKTGDLKILELIEGVAYNFQLIVNKDASGKLLLIENEQNVVYTKAYQYFINESKISVKTDEDIFIARTVFLLVANTSLLDVNEASGMNKTQVVSTFRSLSQNGAKYFQLCKELENSLNKFSFKSSSIPKFGETEEDMLKRLFKYDSSYTSEEISFVKKRLSMLREENKEYFYIFCQVLNSIVEDVLNMHPYFFPEQVTFEDKLLFINQWCSKKFPSFGKRYFLPLLLADYLLCMEYSTCEQKYNKIDYKSHYGERVITPLVDNMLIENVKILSSILNTEEEIKCCNMHGYITNPITVLQCEQEDSFRVKFNKYTNIVLEDVITYG